MKRHSAIAALKAANPVPDAPAAEPLLRRRAQTAWVAVAVGVAAAAAAVAVAVAAPQLAGLPAAQPSDTASAPASPTAIPAESQSPPNPEAVEPVAPAPPDRWPLSGQVLGATAGVAGTAWSASAMAELTDATGAFHFVRVWSWSSLEVHAAGDALDLSHSDAGEPLTLTPVLLLFPEDAHILAPDVPFDGSGVASGGDAVSAGDARAGSPECYESGLMLAPELSGNVYLPTEVDGVRIGVAILQRDGDLLFWVEAHGGDRERARAALESLAINPQGAWTDAATALGLTPPAELEPRLAEFSTAVLEDGSTIERCPLRQATTSE